MGETERMSDTENLGIMAYTVDSVPRTRFTVSDPSRLCQLSYQWGSLVTNSTSAITLERGRVAGLLTYICLIIESTLIWPSF